MLKHIAFVGILLIASPAFAQIFDFSSVETLEKIKAANDEKKEIASDKKIAEEALKAQQAQAAKAKRQQLIAVAKADRQHEIEADKKALAERAYEDRKADKTRDQDYADKLRVLNLQTLQAKADRANDFIDADLSRQTASTDGVQADADRTRMGGEAEIELAENPKVIVVTLLAGLGMIFVMIVVWLARKKRTNPL